MIVAVFNSLPVWFTAHPLSNNSSEILILEEF